MYRMSTNKKTTLQKTEEMLKLVLTKEESQMTDKYVKKVLNLICNQRNGEKDQTEVLLKKLTIPNTGKR